MWLKISLLTFLISSICFANETISLNKNLGESDYLKLNQVRYYKLINKFDYVEITVENGDRFEKEFYLGLKDSKTKDYWGQFTFKTLLSPGVNKIPIHLNRKVGERGSHKYDRKINRKKLKDAFIVFNPGRNTKAGDITIQSMRFYNLKKPALPKGAKYFLFNESDESLYPFAESISDKSKYRKNKNAGFEIIKLWRLRDAKIAPRALSKSMAVTDATFSTDLPAGKYKYELVWNELGYWDVPFWKIRRLYLQSKPVAIESRGSWNDFLKDLFQFKTSVSLPFEQLMNYFKPLEGIVDHKGGKLSFTFEGDKTGASLNSLLIYPEGSSKSVKSFKSALNGLYRAEFDGQYRFVEEKNKANKKEIFLTDALNEHGQCLKRRRNDFLFVDSNQRVRLCLRGYKGERIELKFKGGSPLVYRIQSRFKSLDLNHESYAFRPDTLELVEDSFSLKQNQELIDIEFRGKLPAKNQIEIKIGEKDFFLHFDVAYSKNRLEKLPVNLGFFGPSALPVNYFSDSLKSSWLKKLNKKLVRFLNLSHVNFIVDAPEFSFNYNSDKTNFDLNLASAKNYFYVSEDFKSVLEGNNRNSAQDETSYFENLNLELKGKKVTYLYSDEASGYRDAIDEDLKKGQRIKKQFSNLMIGGFGNLFDFDKAQKLYTSWDVGYYADLPNPSFVKQLNSMHKEWGIYNLCAELSAPIRLCYGLVLYKLKVAGVKNIIEWHLNSAQNYPYFDLDGREADIAFVKTNQSGEILETYRFRELQEGLVIFKKLVLLEQYLASRKVKGLKDTKAENWLKGLKSREIFPVKSFISRFDSKALSNFYRVLDEHSKALLSSR